MAKILNHLGVGIVSFLVLACGAQESVSPATALLDENKNAEVPGRFPHEAFLEGTPAAGSAANIDNVELTSVAGKKGSVVPASLPDATVTVNEIVVDFDAKIVFKEGATHVYDKKNWAVAFGSNLAKFYTGRDSNITIDDQNSFTSGSERLGHVRIRVALAGNKIPSEFYQQLDDVNGRKRLKVVPFYSANAGGFNDTKSLRGLAELFMQKDVGTLKNAPKLAIASVRDGSMVMEVEEPADRSAVQYQSDNSVKDVGASSVSAFILVYWDEKECQASGAVWEFKPNPELDKAKTATPFTCGFKTREARAADATQCDLGCGETGGDYFGLKAEDVAIPSEIPTKNGAEIKKGCYSVVRIGNDGRASAALSNLSNDTSYGVFAYAVDNEGTLSKTRSACVFGKPSEIPLASLEKNPDLKKSRSDCFVVTAASGAFDSDAVHYWRILRDRYLDAVGFSAWYYQNGPGLARWLNAHPHLKPAFNVVFRNTGKGLVWLDSFLVTAKKSVSAWINAFLKVLEQGVFQTAHASEPVPIVVAQGEQPATAPEITTTPKPSSRPSPIPTPMPAVIVPEATHSPAKGASGSTAASDDYPAGSPPGSASSSLYFLFGALKPLEDKNIWEAYYPKRIPFQVVIGQSWRFFDALGEVGLGGELGFTASTGKVPESSPRSGTLGKEVQSKQIGFYSAGLAGVANYRLRLGSAPWLAPRFSLSLGAQRFREEETLSEKEAKAGKNGTALTPIGVTIIKPFVTLRGGLEFSMTRLFSNDMSQLKFGYGLEDFAISLDLAYTKDFGKGLSVSGLTYGLGFVFLLL